MGKCGNRVCRKVARVKVAIKPHKEEEVHHHLCHECADALVLASAGLTDRNPYWKEGEKKCDILTDLK